MSYDFRLPEKTKVAILVKRRCQQLTCVDHLYVICCLQHNQLYTVLNAKQSGLDITRYTHAQMPRAECLFTMNENIIVITSWSADTALLSAGFWPAELVLSPGLVS